VRSRRSECSIRRWRGRKVGPENGSETPHRRDREISAPRAGASGGERGGVSIGRVEDLDQPQRLTFDGKGEERREAASHEIEASREADKRGVFEGGKVEGRGRPPARAGNHFP